MSATPAGESLMMSWGDIHQENTPQYFRGINSALKA